MTTIKPRNLTASVVATLILLITLVTASGVGIGATDEEGFVSLHLDGDSGGEGKFFSSSELELLPPATQAEESQESNEEAVPVIAASLRGTSQNLEESIQDPAGHEEAGVDLPPIPPFHPVHTGSVQYSSTMNPDGTVVYRRDLHAPCDNGMLVFNVGPSKDNLPYLYDVYADAYLYSNNGGLCILYPTYTGYQLSTAGPFWRPGYDPTTVKFNNLIKDPKGMHRISSRVLRPPEANKHSELINRKSAGDYVIMAKTDFYGINYYKRLKDFVNSWGPNGATESDWEVFFRQSETIIALEVDHSSAANPEPSVQ